MRDDQRQCAPPAAKNDDVPERREGLWQRVIGGNVADAVTLTRVPTHRRRRARPARRRGRRSLTRWCVALAIQYEE